MLKLQQLNNLQAAAKHAMFCEIDSGVPCELTIAQWALESGWGEHQPGNNCFGIKEYQGCYGTQLLYTREYLTDSALRQWLAAKSGRTAIMEDGTLDKEGRKLYRCQDYFATFPTLTEAFLKRSQILRSFKYNLHFEQYLMDHNIVRLVQGIAPIYATDPNYSKTVLEIASIQEVQAAIKQVRSEKF